jgi:hypothetical protein
MGRIVNNGCSIPNQKLRHGIDKGDSLAILSAFGLTIPWRGSGAETFVPVSPAGALGAFLQEENYP